MLIAHVSYGLCASSVHAEEDNMNAIPRTRYNKKTIFDNIMSSQLWKECIYRVILFFGTNTDNDQ